MKNFLIKLSLVIAMLITGSNCIGASNTGDFHKSIAQINEAVLEMYSMAGIRHPCTSVSTTSRRVTFDLPPEQAMKELTDAIRRLKEVIEGKYSRQVAVGIDTRAGYGWAESQYADILKCDGTPAGDKI